MPRLIAARRYIGYGTTLLLVLEKRVVVLRIAVSH